VKGRDAAGVGLDLADLVLVQPPQAGDPVGLAAELELGEAGQLRLVDGDDQLAVALEGQALCRAVLGEESRPLDAEPRLQRARGVVDAGVDDAARMPRLVGGDSVRRLEHAKVEDRPPPQQLTRRRQPEDAAADDGDVAFVRRWGVGDDRRTSFLRRLRERCLRAPRSPVRLPLAVRERWKPPKPGEIRSRR
jgi:hypothetical protein